MSTNLHQRLSGIPDEHVLVIAPNGRLSVAEVLQSGPAADIPSDARVLVSIDDVRELTRVLVALDGAVAGILLVSTAQPPEVVEELAKVADCTIIVSDRDDLASARNVVQAIGPTRPRDRTTGWIMTTSGTTGIPKLVPHTLDSLARSVRTEKVQPVPVWGMVYEMTRFAGLQVALQSLLSGGTLCVPERDRDVSEQVRFLVESGCTHLSATPTLWRRLLMAPESNKLTLKQVTLGGEIADQAVLNALAARFPHARLTHIYASTEAGVGFAVKDGKAGFPLSLAEEQSEGVGIRIRDNTLWLRPPGGYRPRYLSGQDIEIDANGYINTGDRLEIAGDRAHFLGRDSSVVNVGGVKVYPERVERVIGDVEGVGLVAVTAKKSPITGALLIASVVPASQDLDTAELKQRIMARCRNTLEREATPARIVFTQTLQTNAAGKISRN
ncbi:class I adenylate-forming enzyme family protein [uncultured Nitratireductor sp.]|uniref:AMP-binding protein n=1 Tax=uncultured Nitratireductor sp. TaxID=520953 RepID=UPI0025D8324E|nr:class I adenylate-forming enzyme family protein [uncultured Nitratireductor sp.]